MGNTRCVLLILVKFSLYFGQISSVIFTSTNLLQNLFTNEKLVLATLDEYVSREVDRIDRLKRNIQLIRQNPVRYDKLKNQPLEFAENPLNAYHIIKKWHGVTTDIHKSRYNNDDFLSRLTDAGLHFPEEDDLDGAVKGLIRLQDTHKLRVEDLARGEIKGYKASAQLDADDYYRLGVSALRSNDLGIAAQWLRGAIKGHIETSSYRLSDALAHLSDAYTQLGEQREAKRVSQAATDFEGQSCSSSTAPVNLTRLCVQKNREGFYVPRNELNKFKKAESDSARNSAALCRGDQEPKDPALNSRLVCAYSARAIPYLRYKQEILNLDPKIVFFHDVLSDRESDLMKTLATPELIRATVQTPETGRIVSEVRIAHWAKLWDDPAKGDHSEEVIALSQKIERISGLSTKYRRKFTSSEPFIVVNYGIGGHFVPHFDFLSDPRFWAFQEDFEKDSGNRIATFLYYLSEPVAGGATVFPRLGVAIPAIKNGAAFWYNMKRDGSFDYRTEHSGCPVLLGQKWLASKIIREFGQEFRRPCGLTTEDPD